MKVFLICYNILVLNFCIIFNEKFVEGRKGIMAKMTYMGGIRIHEGKELSKDMPTTVLLPKGDLAFPSQHIGTPAKPLVSKGDTVLVGQVIGEADGLVSSNIISSVSGTVKR